LKETVRAYIEKAKKYLSSAELLRASGDFDSAASRLYYAMFFCAEMALYAKGLRYSSHRAVISGFSQHLIKTAELPASLGQSLRTAFDERQSGEYEALSQIDEVQVQVLQREAAEFIEITTEYPKGKGLL
jgi:uncharacterized protein (UPF0332 family)